MKKIYKRILKKLADSIIIILFSWIIIFGISFVYAATISQFSYSPPSLTKNQYNNLVNTINQIIITINSGSIGTASIMQTDSSENNCYWANITGQSQECTIGYFVNGMCLSNSIKGCPNGVAGLDNSTWETTGAIKCCRAGSG